MRGVTPQSMPGDGSSSPRASKPAVATRLSLATTDPLHAFGSRKQPLTERHPVDAAGLLAALGTALPLLLLSYSSCFSYSQLIVSGSPVRPDLVAAMHLLSCGLTGLLLPWKSKCKLVVSSADITVTIFYQRVVQDIVETAAAEGALSDSELAATIFFALPLNTFLMGVVFYAVGRAKLTVAVSYLPYQVVAGFLGSIGWAIFSGSFAVLSETKLLLPWGLAKLAEEHPHQLACAVALALSPVLLKSCRIPARLVVILPMLIFLIIFWLRAVSLSLSADELRESGWLFPRRPEDYFWEVWTKQDLSAVSLQCLAPRLSTFCGLGIILVLSLSLRIAGIEGSTGVALDVDDEVKWTGLANMGVGLCGTVIGSHSPGMTTFNQQAGSNDMRPTVLTAVLTLAIWLSGIPVTDALPRFIPAGILMNLGLVMLKEWLWAARTKVGAKGLMVIYAQVASAALRGLPVSVLVGLITACVTNQMQLMELHVLKYHLSGSSIRSFVRWSREEQEILQNKSYQIEALGLEGMLAEGPTLKLCNYIRTYVEANRRVRYMIIDLNFAQGSNASACAIMAKLNAHLQQRSITLLWSNTESQMAKRLRHFGIDRRLIFEQSLFQALAYCEECVLARARSIGKRVAESATDLPKAVSEESVDFDFSEKLAVFLGCSNEEAEKLVARGTWKLEPPGRILAKQGECSHDVHVAIPGASEVQELIDVGENSGEPHRLSSDRLGLICGFEGALYDEPCRCTAVVSHLSNIFTLSMDALKELALDEPLLHASIARKAAMHLLKRCDSLNQAVELNKGGGWKGAHFDVRTAKVAASMVADSTDSRLKRMNSPAAMRRRHFRGGKREQEERVALWHNYADRFWRRKKKDSIMGWARQWIERRDGGTQETLSPLLRQHLERRQTTV